MESMHKRNEQFWCRNKEFNSMQTTWIHIKLWTIHLSDYVGRITWWWKLQNEQTSFRFKIHLVMVPLDQRKPCIIIGQSNYHWKPKKLEENEEEQSSWITSIMGINKISPATKVFIMFNFPLTDYFHGIPSIFESFHIYLLVNFRKSL